jgi:arylsulfatase A-like enzyme
MEIRQAIDEATYDPRAAAVDAPARSASGSASHPEVYHPSALLRRALGTARGAQPGKPVRRESPLVPGNAPPILSLLGASLAVGAASGFLEKAVHAVQLHVLHRVDWTSLMFNRHSGWLVVVVSTLLTCLVSIVLLAPALAWAAWRKRRGGSLKWMSLTWDLAGTVLGTLLLLGPLHAIQGFHPSAPLAVAFGAGVQSRRLLVRRSAAWVRISRSLGVAVIFLLPAYVFWEWHRTTTAAFGAWSRPASRAPNLIWIVLDTLRADHTSLHGYQRATTPALEAWSKRGITFDMARSAAPWTLPSHVTMFTGLWPSEHEARVDQPYVGASPTLAEHLRSAGYATGGVVANVRMCNQVYGVGRGFDTYIDYPWNQQISFHTAMANSKLGASVMSAVKRIGLPAPRHFPLYYRRPARAITKDARQWLDAVQARNEGEELSSRHPFFLFVNLMDVHGPYLPLRNATRKFTVGPIPDKGLAVPECGWRALLRRDQAPPEERPKLELEVEAASRRLTDLYDDCLLGMDAELGRFLGNLEQAGMLENTWVVITADHGEHFGDHNQFGHGSSLYNEMTHVPLLLVPPLGSGEPGRDPAMALRGRRIGAPVSQRDLARTMAGLLDPGADNPFPGRSLERHWHDTHPGRPDAVLSQLEDPRLRGESFRTEDVIKLDSLIDEDHILIVGVNQPPQLYELFNDPRQERNLADRPDQQSRLKRMRATLESLVRGSGSIESSVQ